jgi:hypothetical protein
VLFMRASPGPVVLAAEGTGRSSLWPCRACGAVRVRVEGSPTERGVYVPLNQVAEPECVVLNM